MDCCHFNEKPKELKNPIVLGYSLSYTNVAGDSTYAKGSSTLQHSINRFIANGFIVKISFMKM
jgi:hypothetical protein